MTEYVKAGSILFMVAASLVLMVVGMIGWVIWQ